MQKRGEGGTTVRACLRSKALPTSRSLRSPLLCIRARNSSASLPNRFARVFLLSVTSAPLWLIFLVHRTATHFLLSPLTLPSFARRASLAANHHAPTANTSRRNAPHAAAPAAPRARRDRRGG